MQRDTYDLFHDARPSFVRARAAAGAAADAGALGAAGAAGVLLPLSHGKAMLARRRDGGACTVYVGSHNFSRNAWRRMFQVGLQAAAPEVAGLARAGAAMHMQPLEPRAMHMQPLEPRRGSCRSDCGRDACGRDTASGRAGGVKARSSPSRSSSA